MSEEHHNATWHRLSKRILIQRPLCQDPFGWHAKTGRYAPAECVHHIDSVKDAPTKLFDTSNLLALCSDCHNAVHGKADALNVIINDGVAIDVVARVVATRGLQGRGGGGV